MRVQPWRMLVSLVFVLLGGCQAVPGANVPTATLTAPTAVPPATLTLAAPVLATPTPPATLTVAAQGYFWTQHRVVVDRDGNGTADPDEPALPEEAYFVDGVDATGIRAFRPVGTSLQWAAAPTYPLTLTLTLLDRAAYRLGDLATLVVTQGAAVPTFLVVTNAAEGSEAKMGEPFAIALGETDAISDEGVELTFVAIEEDSRCPIDVECFWEGRAIARLHLTRYGVDLGDFLLTLYGSGRDTAEAHAQFGGLHVQWVALLPKPVSTDTTRAYQGTFLVEGTNAAPPTPATRFPEATPHVGLNFQLRLGQEITLSEAGLTLRLDAVDDERCPALVDCDAPGHVTVQLTATLLGGSVTEMSLAVDDQNRAIPAGMSAPPGVQPLGPHTLRLVAVDPYPQTLDRADIAPGDYVATLVLSDTAAP